MDEFRKKVEKRKRFLMLVTGIVVLLNGVLFFLDNQYYKGSQRIGETISFQVGLLIGLTFLAILAVHKYTHALKDDTTLKQLYIKEHDERNAMIKQKVATSVLITSIIMIVIAISVAVYFEPIVAVTLLVALYVMIIITVIFKIYYRHKC